VPYLTLEKSVRRGRKTWSWAGRDENGNVVSVVVPSKKPDGKSDVVIAEGSRYPVDGFVNVCRAGKKMLVYRSLVGYKKRLWELVNREVEVGRESGRVVLDADNAIIRYLMESVIDGAVDWLNGRGAMVDDPAVGGDEIKNFKLRLLDVLILVWSRRSVGRGKKRYDKSALRGMAKMYLVDLCRRVRKKGAEPGYRNMLEELGGCKSSAEEMLEGCVMDEAIEKILNNGCRM